MGNSCCPGESASLDDRERRELEAIKLAREHSQRNTNYQMVQVKAESMKAESVKAESVKAELVKAESIKDLSVSQIESRIYPAPDYIRAKTASISEKPHLNDLRGAKFMNDPNPTPSPNEQDIYAQIYPPPVSVHS